MPAWRGLQSVSGTDVAAHLVDDWLAAAGLAAISPVSGADPGGLAGPACNA
jgi:hypothetical protein